MHGFMEASKTDQHKEYSAEIYLFCTAWLGCVVLDVAVWWAWPAPVSKAKGFLLVFIF